MAWIINILRGFYMKLGNIASRNPLSFILVMTLLSFTVFFASLPILFFLDSIYPAEDTFAKYGKMKLFIFVVFIAPIVETFVFQFIPIKVLQRKVKSNVAIVIVSSLLFALAHLSSYTYAFSNLLGGTVLASTFIIAARKKFPAYLCTASVHTLNNLIVFIATLIFPD